VSALLYIGTDILGAFFYPGYSYASQAISELSAIGSPAVILVTVLYAVYSVFVLTFGAAVWRDAGDRNQPLGLAGLLLMVYAMVQIAVATLDFGGVTLLNMHPRGTATIGADAPHIILTSVIVLLLLAMMTAGAFAFGRQFRIYSLATLTIVVVFAALTVPFATRIATGQPTPGVGIIERIGVYAGVIWPGVLAMTLLRQPSRAKSILAA